MSEATTITEKSKVPLKIALLLATFAAAQAVSFYAVKRDIAELKRDIVTRSEMIEWTSDLQRANPSINVPKVSGVERPSGNFVNNNKEKSAQ